MPPSVDLSLRGFQFVDLLMYVAALTGLTYTVGVGIVLLLGGSVASLVHFGFVVGFLAFGYATFLLWPSRPWKVRVADSGELEVTGSKSSPVVGEREETWFQRAVQCAPPLRYVDRPASDRLSPGVKLFVASLTVLLVSYLTETVVL